MGAWLAAVLLGALGGLTALRAFTRWRVASSAPVVVLSVGADLVNDLGLHQAPYQALLAQEGARVVEVTRRDPRSAAALLEGADALLLTGGGDIDPRCYGPSSGAAWLVDPERDAFEAALLREALRRDLPVLAVCRGVQLVNVALGGTLRDLRQEPTLAQVHGITPRSLVAHPVELAPGSLVREAAQAPRITVNSFHGQAVDRVAPGLVAAAVSPDGVVEALEVPTARFALAVQWHPELLYFTDTGARRLFQRFLAEARAPRRA